MEGCPFSGMFFLAFISMLASRQIVQAASQQIDVTGPGCDRPGGFMLEDQNDIITIFARPRFNTVPTRDHCDVEVRAQPGRRIQYLIEKIFFHECGIEIILYDTSSDINPQRIVTCDDDGRTFRGTSKYDKLRIRVRKTTTQSRNFEFQMKMKDDRGPSIEYSGTEANYQYQGEAIDSGAIVGIAIAGAIIILALIPLAL